MTMHKNLIRRFENALAFLYYNRIKGLAVLLSVFFLVGCKTVSTTESQKESSKEVEGALTAVAGAISGRSLDENDVKNLEKQIRTDEEAQSAIQAITGSVGGQAQVVKYCPITGKRYAPSMEYCPIHNVELKIVEP